MPTRLWRQADGPPGCEAYMRRWMSVHALEYLEHDAVPLFEPLREPLDRLERLILSHPTYDVCTGDVALDPRRTISVAGEEHSVPLSMAAAARVYELSAESALGVEGRGTVHDAELRKSREIPFGGSSEHSSSSRSLLSLSVAMRRFAFPEARAEVHRALCPTATELEFRPYKLVTYARGDFFAYHADTMSDPDMIGSLALQIPIDQPLPDAAAAAAAADATSSSSSAADSHVVFRSRHRSAGGGDAVQVSADLVSWDPTSGIDADGRVRVRFAAWLGDVQHEVRPVAHPYRMVLLYRLYKRGGTWAGCIPPWFSTAVRADLATFFSGPRPLLPINVPIPICGEECDDPVNEAEGVVADPSRKRRNASLAVSCIGILLQHWYRPEGLTVEALVGSDADAYRAISATHECHLMFVCGVVQRPFDPRRCRDCPTPVPTVFRCMVAAEAVDVTKASLFSGHGHPYVTAAFTELGFREELGGGIPPSYGDGDTQWWYRSAALMVLPRWSLWRRARWFFAAVHKGEAPHIERLLAVHELFQHVLRFL